MNPHSLDHLAHGILSRIVSVQWLDQYPKFPQINLLFVPEDIQAKTDETETVVNCQDIRTFSLDVSNGFRFYII